MKNVIATRYVYQDIKDLKTVGAISEDKKHEVVEIAEPLGPIFALTPITNPTSTVLFKILISLKTRNPIVIRPHGAAKKCSIEAARICYEAALKAGAPEYCIQWVKRSTDEQTRMFMSHRKTALVLATGSVNLVREAYRSGNPAIGVGPGNVPVYIGRTADIPFAVEQIFISKTFDNGTVCASEQALIANRDYVDEVISELKKRNAYFLTKDETELLEKIAYNKEQMVMNAGIIGQPATVIAKMAGFEVPYGTALLIAELDDVGRKINVHGGMGHTVSIFSNDEDKIEYFASVMNAGRILVNTPASHGALGGTYNALRPSLVLACGTGGKNITTDNISAKHLLNIHRVARRKVSDCFVCDHYNYLDETKDAQSVDKECTNYEK
jgi:acetaldehyde dehydrogenase/alcohol dehydrogenase